MAQWVRAGEVLVQLDQRDLKAQLLLAQRRRKISREALLKSQRSGFEEREKLAEIAMQQMQLDLARLEEEAVLLRLKSLTLTAPHDGIV